MGLLSTKSSPTLWRREEGTLRKWKLSSMGLIMLWGASTGAFGSFLVPIGSVFMTTDSPSAGLTSFIVSNDTGLCSAGAEVCTPVLINDGLLEIELLDGNDQQTIWSAVLPDGFGPGQTDPVSFVDFSFDLAGQMVQRVTFSGLTEPALLALLDGRLVEPAPQRFTASFSPGDFGPNEVPYAELKLEVSEVQSAIVPEPGLWIPLGLGLSLGALCLFARRGRKSPQLR